MGAGPDHACGPGRFADLAKAVAIDGVAAGLQAVAVLLGQHVVWRVVPERQGRKERPMRVGDGWAAQPQNVDALVADDLVGISWVADVPTNGGGHASRCGCGPLSARFTITKEATASSCGK
ncbi:MAG: hypothetical protein EOO77_43025 [Oxalobacteraceae bacterium]|nr:MAG: hypothetical protein EOO77_43025 [Oxalobacteraceae bacterium]